MAVVILHVHKHGKKVTRKFKSGGLHERHVVATLETGEPSELSLVDTGKPSVFIRRASHLLLFRAVQQSHKRR